MKICRCCGVEKENAEFHPYPRNRDGLQSYCIACQAAKKRAKYAQNADSLRAEALARYERKKASGGITEDAKAAKSAYDRRYRDQNEERLNAIKSAWRAENPDLVRAVRVASKAKRRTLIAGGDTSRAVRNWLIAQARVCRWCGADCADNFHVDHVVPLSRGGRHVTSNLCISCPTCNVRKHAKLPEEWERRLVNVQ